jgi:TRAP-type C4-dicarboxylate transport system permease small subunit
MKVKADRLQIVPRANGQTHYDEVREVSMVKSPSTGMHNLAFRSGEREGSRFKFLNSLELFLGGFFLLLIFVMVLWQVLSRYVLVLNWAGAGELARYGLVALTFVLVGYLFGAGQHITITILDGRLRPIGQAVLKAIAAFLVLIISAAFVWGAINLLFDPFTQSRTTSVVRIPMTYITLIPLFGFVMMVLRAAEALWVNIAVIRRGV